MNAPDDRDTVDLLHPVRPRSALAEVHPGRYLPGPEIARGGMGRIIAARDRVLGRVVAIKELLDWSPARAARFEREALISARLQHPAIVNVLDAGRWPSGEPFYVMKLVTGRSLAQIAEAQLPVDDRLALLPHLIAMVEAVAHAHGQGIIHRDLKPSNVLVGELGETVVIDWGLAKDRSTPVADRQHLTGNGAVIGTPGYMPPEQADGEEVDERADVYALGAILYHLLGGHAPFRGSPDEALAAVRRRGPAPLASVEPALPDDLVTIIEKAMARQPGRRYASAVPLAHDLLRFQRGHRVAAHRYTWRQLLQRFAARHRAPLAITVAAMVAISGVTAVGVRRALDERARIAAEHAQAARLGDEARLTLASHIARERDAVAHPQHALRRCNTDCSPNERAGADPVVSALHCCCATQSEDP